MTPPASRARVLWAALLLLGVAWVPAEQSAGAEQCKSSARPGTWSAIATPAGSSGSSTFRAAAYTPLFRADPSHPGRLFVTNTARRSVSRSTDGGCTWQTVLSADNPVPANLPGPVTADPAYRIESLVVVPASHGPQYVYAAFVDRTQIGTPLPLFVAVSKDGGATWTLPGGADALTVATTSPACSAVHLEAAPSQPRTIYADCSHYAYGFVAASATDSVSVSHDAGQTWSHPANRSLPPAYYSAHQGFVVDPLDAKSLWIVGVGNDQVDGKPSTYTTLFHSADGAESWTQSSLRARKLGDNLHAPWAVDIAIRHAAGKPATILVYAGYAAYLSRDGGRHWRGPLVALGRAAFDGDIAGAAFASDDRSFYAALGSPHSATDGINVAPDPCGTHNTGFRAARYDVLRKSWRTLAPAPRLASGSSAARVSQVSVSQARQPSLYWLQTQTTSSTSNCTFVTRILRYTP